MKFFMISFLLLASVASQATVFTCTNKDILDNLHVLHRGQATYKCHSLDFSEDILEPKKDKIFKTVIEGYGPGLKVERSKILINCPGISTENITKSPFYGLEAALAAVVGGRMGFFMNKRLGSCFLSGLGFGAGAAVDGAKMTFSIPGPNETFEN